MNKLIIDNIKVFYKEFDAKNLEGISEIYADNLIFIDPFHKIEGIANLKKYFSNLAANMNYCRFHFKQEAINNDNVFLQWRMEYSHPSIKKGNQLLLDGVSHLIINSKIVFHRDYFDSSEMLYKHIPMLGSVIRTIEKNMGS